MNMHVEISVEVPVFGSLEDRVREPRMLQCMVNAMVRLLRNFQGISPWSYAVFPSCQ